MQASLLLALLTWSVTMFLQTNTGQTAGQALGGMKPPRLRDLDTATSHIVAAQQRHQRMRMHMHISMVMYSARKAPHLGQGLQGAAPRPYTRPGTP
jgi:hypothetical protein